MGSLDFPQTEEGLQAALASLAEARATGDRDREGEILLRLSHLVKWVRSDNEQAPFERAETLALNALEAFRAIGNERGQARSLIYALSPFDRAVLAQRLDEAEQIARRIDDRSLIASVLAARARAASLSDLDSRKRYALEALEIYRELGSFGGMAMCLFTLSIGNGGKSEKRAYALEASRCYRESGDLNHAGKSLMIASMNCDSDHELVALEPLYLEVLNESHEIGNRSNESMCYGGLARICEKKCDMESALRYKRWQADLQQADGLTELERGSKMSR